MDHFSLFILHSSFSNCSKGKKCDKLSDFEIILRKKTNFDFDYQLFVL